MHVGTTPISSHAWNTSHSACRNDASIVPCTVQKATRVALLVTVRSMQGGFGVSPFLRILRGLEAVRLVLWSMHQLSLQAYYLCMRLMVPCTRCDTSVARYLASDNLVTTYWSLPGLFLADRLPNTDPKVTDTALEGPTAGLDTASRCLHPGIPKHNVWTPYASADEA